MKVTQIISDTNIGGGGKSLLNYLQHADRKTFPPSVILPKNAALTPLLQNLDIPLLEIDGISDKSYDKSAHPQLNKALKELNPDLVHTHGSLSGRIIAKKQKRKILYTKHCAFPPSGLKATPLGKFLVSTLDKSLGNAVIAVGHSAKDNLIASGIQESRIHTLYNGVTPLTPLSPDERSKLRESYGFTDTDFVVGILARVEPYKGHETLLQAIQLLHQESLPMKLLVVGEGSFLPELKEKAKSLPENTVHFTGFISDVQKPLSAMDIQVNASFESETSCLSLLEGMSISLPAIASNLGGNPYLIHENENGLLFPPKDETTLAKQIKTLYSDKTLYKSLQEGAITRYNQEFTGTQFAKNIETIYSSL